MTLFERFKDTKEEGFRNEFVKPLLACLGFIGISNEHGVNEFGKDFVFSELDRFGKLRHMIVQAKHQEKINQGKKVDDLLTQIRQAFFVPYTLPSSPSEQRYVSSVYVFNTGVITDNAKTQIIHSLAKEMAANTQFFGGEQLETLENVTSYQDARRVRERLAALRSQLAMNIQIWRELRNGVSVQKGQTKLDVRGGILHGIEQFLSEPIFPDRIPLQEMANLWEEAKIIQTIMLKHYLLPIAEPGRTKDINLLVKLCDAAIHRAAVLIVLIIKAIQALPK